MFNKCELLLFGLELIEYTDQIEFLCVGMQKFCASDRPAVSQIEVRNATPQVAVCTVGCLPALGGTLAGCLWSRPLYLITSPTASSLALKTVLSNDPLSPPGMRDNCPFSTLISVSQSGFFLPVT